MIDDRRGLSRGDRVRVTFRERLGQRSVSILWVGLGHKEAPLELPDPAPTARGDPVRSHTPVPHLGGRVSHCWLEGVLVTSVRPGPQALDSSC